MPKQEEFKGCVIRASEEVLNDLLFVINGKLSEDQEHAEYTLELEWQRIQVLNEMIRRRA